MENQNATKKRRPNWSRDEAVLLSELVGRKKCTIEGRFSSSLTASDKQEAWQWVADNVNSTFNHERSRDEVEKKWRNLKMIARKEVSYHRSQTMATGGGQPPEVVSVLSESVVEVMGKDNLSFTGIPGGSDSTAIQLCSINDQGSLSTLGPTTVHTELPSTETSDDLLKRKLKLKIECLELKKEYLTKKIRKLEDKL